MENRKRDLGVGIILCIGLLAARLQASSAAHKDSIGASLTVDVTVTSTVGLSVPKVAPTIPLNSSDNSCHCNYSICFGNVIGSEFADSPISSSIIDGSSYQLTSDVAGFNSPTPDTSTLAASDTGSPTLGAPLGSVARALLLGASNGDGSGTLRAANSTLVTFTMVLK